MTRLRRGYGVVNEIRNQVEVCNGLFLSTKAATRPTQMEFARCVGKIPGLYESSIIHYGKWPGKFRRKVNLKS